MKNIVIPSVFLLTSLSFSGVSYACDLHGAGYGSFGISGANWEPYNPQASITDPSSLGNKYSTSIDFSSLSAEKPKPSFSNAASLAATKAKARIAEKTETKKPTPSTLKTPVKKAAALNSDR